MKNIINHLEIILSIVFALSSIVKADIYVKEYTYKANELDNENTARQIALARVKQDLLEEIGVYMKSTTTYNVQELRGKTDEEFKKEIVAVTAGITKTKILYEKWNDSTFYIKAQIEVDKDDFQMKLNNVIENNELKTDLASSKNEIEKLLQEIASLKTELASSQIDKTEIKNLYIQKSNNIASEDIYQSAVNANESGDKQEMRKLAQQAIDLNPKNERAKKLLSTLEYLGSEERIVANLKSRIKLGYEYSYDSPTFLHHTSLYFGTYGLIYTPTYFISKIWKPTKTSNNTATYTALGWTCGITILYANLVHKSKEELRAEYDTGWATKSWSDSYIMQLLGNTVSFSMAGFGIS